MSRAGPPLLVRRLPISPVVSLRLFFPGGARREDQPGLSWLSGALLGEGTARWNHRQLAERVEARGMMLSTFGGVEGHGLSLEALADDWPLVLDLAAEVVFEPRFSASRFRWLRRQAINELRSQLDQPEVRTGWVFLRQLYGGHARGRPLQGTEESLRQLSVESCRSFHEASWGGVVVTIAGRVPEDEVRRRAMQRFAPSTSPAPSSIASGPVSEAAFRQEIQLPDAEQAQLMLGHLTVPRDHPDHTTLELLAVILGSGAGLTGRIPGRLRERDGLAYAASAGTVSGAGLDPGALQIRAGVSPRRVRRAERAAREEIDRLLADGVTERELTDARGYLLGREPFRRETARQWSGLLLEALLYGLPIEGDREARLSEIDRPALLEVARRHLRPAELRVTVGMPAKGS